MFKNFSIITICRRCFQFSAIFSKYNDVWCERSCMTCKSYTLIDNTLIDCEGA